MNSPESLEPNVIVDRLRSLVAIREWILRLMAQRCSGLVAPLEIEEMLYDVAVEVSMNFDASRGCKLTTRFCDLANKRINGLLEDRGCIKCPECHGSCKIEGAKCHMCRSGVIKRFHPMGDQDYLDCELSITQAEWLGTYLGEAEIPATFLTHQSDDFVQFAKRLKNKLPETKRIILGAFLNGRELKNDELDRLQRLGQAMSRPSINKARFDARKTLGMMLSEMIVQNGREDEAAIA